ncbi:uncharacterized protein LOC127738524 [Mytilus californianus]|uniref:uncharacterized protein LOC127738524 n=1 Tax=Mytilus californianus TaxID=6549 RepID=UPI0022466F56|nr:uncharacterized protein LOC127738524 [Mytilus californianus]
MEETVGVTKCSKEETKDYQNLTDNKTSKFQNSAMEGTNKKAVLDKAEDIEFENENRHCINVSKTDVQRAKLCLTENETGSNNIIVNIETRYISKEGYFQHTVVSEHQKERMLSIFSGRLKFGNKNQLLTLFDEDVTLMTHEDVLARLRNNMDEKNHCNTGTVKEEICETDGYTLGSAISGEVHYETSGSANKCERQRMITLEDRQTSKFMQIQNGQIAFTELISSRLCMKVGDFHKSHFKEESHLNQDGTYWLKRYIGEEHKQYLNITQDGYITLRKDRGTFFQIKSSSKGAFFIVEEMAEKKLLCFNGHSIRFVEYPNSQNNMNYIDYIPEKFRFQVKKVLCNR